MFTGLDSSNFSDFFELAQDSRCRGHNRKIIKKFCRVDARKYFFSQRVVGMWNGLPQEVVESSSLNMFKGSLMYR